MPRDVACGSRRPMIEDVRVASGWQIDKEMPGGTTRLSCEVEVMSRDARQKRSEGRRMPTGSTPAEHYLGAMI